MISKIRKPVDCYFEQYTAALNQAMKSDISVLNDIDNHLRKSRGKQLRPLLVLLSGALCGEVNKDTIASAVALELLHTASLIHDDVLDDAMERRSQPSVKALWDNKVAILSGDFYLSKVLQIISTVPLDIIVSIGNLGAALSEGEIEQLSLSKHFSAQESDYFDIIRKKTASLFSTCTFAGSRSVNADSSTVERLKNFGEILGIIFQIKDDIFDYFESNELGKPIGNDLAEGKLTLPLLYALSLENGKAEDYKRLLASSDSLSSAQVLELYRFAKDMGGIEYAEKTMERFKNEALELLSVFPNSDVKHSLLLLLEYCIERHH